MAKKKLFRTDKNADATRKAKPLGYRYKNLDPMDSRYFKRPTAEEIEKFHAGDKKMKKIIAFEDRPERSDKNQKNKLAKGGSLDIQFPNSNLYLVGKGLDYNGNYIVKVTFPNQRAFSIQTNGVLPRTQNNLKSVDKISELTEDQLLQIEKEVVDYVDEFGSKTQKSKLKKYSGFDSSDIEDEDDDESKLEHIGHLITEGYTSGYYPTWTLKIDFDGDIDDSDREHIGKQVTNGMTSGEIVSGEEGKTGWWSIDIEDGMKDGGEVSTRTQTISGVKHNKIKGQVDYHSMEKMEEFSHPLGTVYNDGKYGYVASGYDWLRFDIKDLDRIKKRMKDGGKVGGRGFFGLEKGKKITNMNQIEKDAIILTHSTQFNADNTLKVVGKRQYGNSYVVFDTIYWDVEKNKRIGNEEMSISKNNLTWDEYYLPETKLSGIKAYKQRRDSVIAKVKKIKSFKE